ncbi:MAG: AbrB/MazE/SpoVT family DNA-binding domain-containing protein [archaeon]|nr:AbrB/MazE/SpoVT family DNA-binding domain-containing protein [archaeon]
MVQLTKVTSKGQVVIPSEIRKELKLEEGSQLAVSRVGSMVVMKRVSLPDPKKEFEELVKWGIQFAKKKGIKSEKDVLARIHKGRGIKHD